MECIRLVKRVHFDQNKSRFTSPAFEPSSDGSGISVISISCILDQGKSICDHIREFYKQGQWEPYIFWRFSTDILPNGCELVSYPVENGDMCHCNLVGLPKNTARQIFRQYSSDLSHFWICDGDSYKALTEFQGDIWLR